MDFSFSPEEKSSGKRSRIFLLKRKRPLVKQKKNGTPVWVLALTVGKSSKGLARKVGFALPGQRNMGGWNSHTCTAIS